MSITHPTHLSRTTRRAGARHRMIESLEPRTMLAFAQVAGLTLLNADTGQPVPNVQLLNGATIDLAVTGPNLAVRADVLAGEIGAVRFNLDGNPANLDSTAPFFLGGDTFAWRPEIGTHTLAVATAGLPDGGGARGYPLAISFDVIDSSVTAASGGTPSPVYVNAGGPAYVDSLGRRFKADVDSAGWFTGGRMQTVFDDPRTEDDLIFQSARFGSRVDFGYPLPNGRYAVWLEFAEPNAAAAPGDRVFDVLDAAGNTLLNDVDITAAGGTQKAVAKSFEIEVTTGRFEFSLVAQAGDAIVSGVVMIPTDIPDPMLSYSDDVLSDAAKQTLAASRLRTLGQAAYFYALGHKGMYPATLDEVATEASISVDTFANPRLNPHRPRGLVSPIETAAWRAGLDGFVYVGKDKTTATPPNEVMAYENPALVAGGLNVLFFDGHVEFLSRQAAGQIIPLPPTEPPPVPPVIAPPMNPKVLQSMSNLSAIGEAMLYYANDNKGRTPVTLGGLHQYIDISADKFFNPRGTVPPMPAGLTREQASDWIDGRTDYLLIASSQRWTFKLPDEILVCENPVGMADGVAVLRADGRVEYVEMRWAMEYLSQVRSRVLSPGLHLSGNVFVDANANGVKDPAEQGEYDWSSTSSGVFVDLNDDGVYQLGEPFSKTDFNGAWRIDLPTGGTGTLRLNRAGSTHTLSTPALGFYAGTVATGEVIRNLDFGVVIAAAPVPTLATTSILRPADVDPPIAELV